MPAHSVLAFWAVALLLIVIPGADWAFTLGTALRGGPVAAAVGGLVLGYTAMTLVVAAGTGALVAGTPLAMTVLTVAGGLYLVWLGVTTLVGPVPTPAGATSAGPVDAAPGAEGRDGRAHPAGWALLARGVGVSGLNPKALLLFVALLPQFTDARWDWPVAVQLGLLGLLFTLTCAIFYATMGRFARTVLRARPATARVVSRLSGVGMVAIGVSLLIEHLHH
ncbi:LysE family translocator [Micromonospora sp. WMMD812]|uniref:LysE family translocator n=1 Tax=Micromonospora sp. WMMD812 TaxID=3015152 RepID=UPI00248C2787|nr:LysE family translocator [Micromonospora sp. WMMD812]WBB69960.1 LysE family translocator [Micromonospora sp. WMMD812]